MAQNIPLLRTEIVSRSTLNSTLMILCGSLLVALGAQIEVPMVPVPMSLQTLAISVVGLTFGARMAGMALLAYLAEGAAGLPVFSGGSAGVQHLFGPTGGFLWGFVAMAWMTGWMAERGMARGFGRMFVAAIVPATLLFVPGVLWLYAATPLSLKGAMDVGMMPFLIGDVVKSTLSALVVAGGWQALSRRG